jgi:hypothetical protein
MNQFPTTDKQLELYRDLNRNQVEYMLIGGLAARFHGRNRVTKDVDLLVNNTSENGHKLKTSLQKLGYPVNRLSKDDFVNHEYIRIGGKMLIDFHTSYFGIKFDDATIKTFRYQDLEIPVADKPSLIRMLTATGVHSEDIRILKLLDDPVNNAEEINRIQ